MFKKYCCWFRVKEKVTEKFVPVEISEGEEGNDEEDKRSVVSGTGETDDYTLVLSNPINIPKHHSLAEETNRRRRYIITEHTWGVDPNTGNHIYPFRKDEEYWKII